MELQNKIQTQQLQEVNFDLFFMAFIKEWVKSYQILGISEGRQLSVTENQNEYQGFVQDFKDEFGGFQWSQFFGAWRKGRNELKQEVPTWSFQILRTILKQHIRTMPYERIDPTKQVESQDNKEQRELKDLWENPTPEFLQKEAVKLCENVLKHKHLYMAVSAPDVVRKHMQKAIGGKRMQELVKDCKAEWVKQMEAIGAKEPDVNQWQKLEKRINDKKLAVQAPDFVFICRMALVEEFNKL